MSDFSKVPISDMAMRHAELWVDRIMETEDPVERTRRLILSSVSGYELVEITELSLMETLSPAFNAGIHLTLRMLLEAGLTEDQLPTDKLIERAKMVSLRSSALVEASAELSGTPISDLYLPEEGGTGSYGG